MSWGYMIGAGRTVLPAGVVDHRSSRASPSCSRCSALNLVGEGLNDALNPRLARDGR